MKTELTLSEKLQAKEISIKLSRDLNPNTYELMKGADNYAYTSNPTAPTLSKVLDDAEKIYNWLTK